MKILYVSASKIPSTQANSVHVMNMCQALAIAGHKTTLIIRRGEFKCYNKHNYYGIKKIFQIKEISYFSGFFEKISYILAISYFLIKKGKEFDFIYTRFFYIGWLAVKLNLHFIYESHELPRNKINYWMENAILQAKKIKKFVVISQALKNKYLKMYPWLDINRIIVAHDGANIDIEKKYISNIKIFGKKNKIKVGYVGSLYPGRGIEIIMQIADKLTEIEFHIIGGSKEEITQYKSLSKNIYFYGFIPHNKISFYIKNFDILLAPYQKKVSLRGGKGDTSEWMSPLKLFEYMAQGKAIICSDLSVLKEILTHNKNALLCDPENINEWIGSINKLKNINLRKFLGENAKQELKKKYTWQNRIRKIFNKKNE